MWGVGGWGVGGGGVWVGVGDLKTKFKLNLKRFSHVRLRFKLLTTVHY